MARTVSLTRRLAFETTEIARFVIVTACGAALIAAGQALPV